MNAEQVTQALADCKQRYVCPSCGKTCGEVDRARGAHSRPNGGGRCYGVLKEHTLVPAPVLRWLVRRAFREA